VRFPLGATIRGRVLHDGRPAVSGIVYCGEAYARVDGAGQYVCEGVPPQETLVIAYRERGGGSAEATVTATAGEVKEVNLELVSPGASVSGVVLDEGGEPVAGAQVILFARNADAASEPTTLRGEFRMEHVAAGSFDVAVRDEDGRTSYGAPNGSGFPRVVVTDRDVKDVRVIVRRPKLLTIAGKVVDGSGAPVPDARIDVLRLEPGMDPQFDTYER
jgi:protocatechuate 3,4-dioxygenase beta subunit